MLFILVSPIFFSKLTPLLGNFMVSPLLGVPSTDTERKGDTGFDPIIEDDYNNDKPKDPEPHEPNTCYSLVVRVLTSGTQQYTIVTPSWFFYFTDEMTYLVHYAM